MQDDRNEKGPWRTPNLADAWLEYHRAAEASGAFFGDGALPENGLEALESLDRLVRKDPEEAWRTILEIVTRAASDAQLASLAAGPLEDLLAYHGNEFIDRIELAALGDRRFRQVLWGVWRNEMDDDLWTRVEKVRRAG